MTFRNWASRFFIRTKCVPAQAPVVTTRWETSRNWSGASILPRNGNTFTEVAGGWTVPQVPADAQPFQSSSIWVGLDGQRRYFNSSLPQIGTTQEFNVTTNGIEYYAMYQWWARGQVHAKPHKIRDITLTAGDSVFCNVQVVDKTHAIVSIVKFGTPNQFWSKILRAPKIAGSRPQISGATAEWIVERPTLPDSDELLNLIHYGTVDFTACVAVTSHLPDFSPTEYQSLDGAQFKRMVEPLDGPTRIVRLSEPRRWVPDQPEAFNVTYVGP
ncbi:MAG TPA: G1 family glutamic endopeptidase [Acetobacteraceae bacterium]|nr:G1 family glutamic endopeptidase [Acetobacteraceae bacterium]